MRRRRTIGSEQSLGTIGTETASTTRRLGTGTVMIIVIKEESGEREERRHVKESRWMIVDGEMGEGEAEVGFSNLPMVAVGWSPSESIRVSLLINIFAEERIK